jgi:aldose 1-epimerase
VVSGAKSALTLETRVNVQPGWPVPLRTTVRYALDRAGLQVTHAVTNIGESLVPFGLGVHCYPRVGNAATDHSTLQLAATTVFPVDVERKLPTGEQATVFGGPYDFSCSRTLAGVVLDTAFGGCTPVSDDDAKLVRHLMSSTGTALEIWADQMFKWVQVCVVDSFPGRGRAVAVEPMTCPPDALRSGVDLIWLAPDETWAGAWGLRPLAPAS